MGNTFQYRISLIVNGLTTYVSPIYTKMILNEQEEKDQKYLRPELDTEFTFVRSDFDYLHSLPVSQEVEVVVEQLNNINGAYVEKFRGVFTGTDPELWDEDNKLVKVSPRPRDQFELILQGLQKEFNIPDLAPELTEVNYKQRPIIQAYWFDSNYVTNYTHGNYWDSPLVVGSVSASDLVTKYRFTLASQYIYITGDAGNNPDISGKYDPVSGLREDGAYDIYFHEPESRFVVRELPSETWVYQLNSGEQLTNSDNWLLPGATLLSNIDAGVSKAQAFLVSVYLRYYTNQEEIDGVPTYLVPADDLVAPNPNYSRIIGVSADNFTCHNGHQTAATRYGKYIDGAINFPGEYFTIYTPDGAPFVGPAYPVSRSDWAYFSLWFRFTPFNSEIEDRHSTIITLRDGYKLPDLIKAFLAQIDPSITHEEDPAYSDFFYGPDNPIHTETIYPIFTAKSNILQGNYEAAAKKAPLKFGDLLEFLKIFYGVYWTIRDSMFILEHEEYFERGGSYYTENVGDNATSYLEPKSGRAWTFRTNNYKHEKIRMPEREEYSWMDNQSRIFEGYPIDMLSDQVDKGNVEDYPMSLFSADVDYALASPGEVVNSGWFFLEATLEDGAYWLPFVTLQFDGLQFEVQNGYATLAYAHANYHLWQLPCSQVRINDEEAEAQSLIRSKIQEIKFPVYIDTDSLALVTTTLGNGKIESRSLNMLSGMLTLKLRHEQ